MAELIATSGLAAQLDDCWNRIGYRGDKSCQKLAANVHCRNCDVYAAAATRMLDRYQLRDDVDSIEEIGRRVDTEATATESLVIFRLGDEWLGLPTRILVEAAPQRPIHSLPHRRSPAMLGVSNVRGTLVAAVSLTILLGLDPASTSDGNRAIPRMLIIEGTDGGHVVCPVDEISGIYAVPSQLYTTAGSGKFSRALLQWQSRSVRLLDATALLDAIHRSLA